LADFEPTAQISIPDSLGIGGDQGSVVAPGVGIARDRLLVSRPGAYRP
jgi:hypothetical protein